MSTTTNNAVYNAAQHLHGLGLTVIPIVSKDKRPLISWEEFQHRVMTPNEIDHYFSNDCNIAVVCGLVTVIDFDEPDIYTEFIQKHADALVGAAIQQTGRGYQVFIRTDITRSYPAEWKGKHFGDVKGSGGYVLVPPSVHPNGKTYQWIKPLVSIEALPFVEDVSSLGISKLEKSKSSSMATGGILEAANEIRNAQIHTRNTTLSREAGRLFRHFRDSERESIVKTLSEAASDSGLDSVEIQNTLQSAARYGDANPLPQYYLTDLGNVERFLDVYGQDILYCGDMGKWIIWRDGRWKVDDGEVLITEWCAESARSILCEALLMPYGDERKSILRWWGQSESCYRLNELKRLLESNVYVPINDLDSIPDILQVNNGVIDLNTGSFREAKREDRLTRCCNVAYDPDAQCPGFMQFLIEISMDDCDWICYLQTVLGLTLSGRTDYQQLWFLHGGGANGKSTLLNIISHLLGDYSWKLESASLMQRRGDRIRNDLAALKGKRFVHCSETSEGQWMDAELVKDLTGGDVVTARFLNREYFQYRPQFTLIMYGNSRPRLQHVDEGIRRRVKMIPFDFRAETPDEHLFNRLINTELPGILNWLLEGLMRYNSIGVNGLKALEPVRVKVETDDYFNDNDRIKHFLEECCNTEVEKGTPPSTLYAAFHGWCDDAGMKPYSRQEFNRQLEKRGFDRSRTNNERYWKFLSINGEGRKYAVKAGYTPQDCQVDDMVL